MPKSVVGSSETTVVAIFLVVSSVPHYISNKCNVASRAIKKKKISSL